MKTEMRHSLVGTIVADNPAVAGVFEKHGIDYCCRGRTSLADACNERHVPVEEVLAGIEAVRNAGPATDDADWNEAGLAELADHIVDVHHGFLASELPRTTGLIEKVCNAHGKKHAELTQVQEAFRLLREHLESHMAKEENVLFPAIRRLEACDRPPRFLFGSVANPIRMMEREHDDAGDSLRTLRELTNGYTPPRDACPTYRVMLESLERIERDLHLHIHKENNILFPRAAACELSLAAR